MTPRSVDRRTCDNICEVGRKRGGRWMYSGSIAHRLGARPSWWGEWGGLRRRPPGGGPAAATLVAHDGISVFIADGGASARATTNSWLRLGEAAGGDASAKRTAVLLPSVWLKMLAKVPTGGACARHGGGGSYPPQSADAATRPTPFTAILPAAATGRRMLRCPAYGGVAVRRSSFGVTIAFTDVLFNSPTPLALIVFGGWRLP